ILFAKHDAILQSAASLQPY
ncbi:hypothetical protein ATR1_067d0318, partial [Acetobacter tropicalis]